ncbi:TonB-dependent siderophore receptor [Achromobacter arsenitoxydans]|uniref:Iron(III) dicitrate transporter FecA n=1 Tax=Achromobacter arsenitoxydans SY8 TaxID=477184 RepID=H0F837_9BURK|nr:TonB-dependent receptor [Achromobacter arsenitoxydans]EHK65470.1 iron(III) dicitrate transporter FecA [Achromobacter arsenitoxydans SY8]
MAPKDNFHARAATRVLRLAGLTLSLAAAFAVAPQAAAQGAQPAATQDYRIPAGPLDQALSAFAKAGGLTVSFKPEETRGLTTAGLDGSYKPEAGLAKLLAGTGLTAVAVGGQGYVVRAAAPAPAKAAPAASANTLESIQVSGDWLGTGLENSVQTFGGARTLLKRDEIQNSGATSVADALRRVPGVQISGSTSASGSSVGLHVGIRGLNPRNSFRTTMLLDGIPMAMAPYGQPNLVMSPTSLGNIDAIDVVRGGGAVRYGPQNVGGVINFRTRPIPTGAGLVADASARYNMYSHGGENTQYTAFLGTQFDNGLGVALMYSGMDGQQWRDGSDDRYNDVALKWRYELTPTSEIYGKFAHYDVKSMTPGGLTVAQYRDDPFQNTHPTDYWKGQRDQIDVGYLNSISDTQEFEARIYHYDSSRQSSLINTAARRNDYQPRNNQVLGIEPRYTQRVEWGPTTHDVTIGYRYIHETGQDRRYSTSLATDQRVGVTQVFDNETEAHSLYLDDRIAFGKWRVTPGVRYEHIDTNRQPSGTGNDTPFDLRNSRGLPSLNVAYLVNDALTLYANYNTSFGAVQYTQLNSMSASNPLSPEVAKTMEAGLRYSGEQTHTEFTVFNLRFDNQILSIPGTNPAVFRNLGATTHNGVEFAIDYDFDKSGPLAGLNVYANYTYVRAIQKSGEFEGNDVPFYSRQTGTLGGRYTRNNWTFNLFTTAQSGQYSDTANTEDENADASNGRVPGFSVWNTQLSYKLPQWKGSELAVGVNNLFDRRYYTRNVDTNGGRMVGAPRMVYLQARLAY